MLVLGPLHFRTAPLQNRPNLYTVLLSQTSPIAKNLHSPVFTPFGAVCRGRRAKKQDNYLATEPIT